MQAVMDLMKLSRLIRIVIVRLYDRYQHSETYLFFNTKTSKICIKQFLFSVHSRQKEPRPENVVLVLIAYT